MFELKGRHNSQETSDMQGSIWEGKELTKGLGKIGEKTIRKARYTGKKATAAGQLQKSGNKEMNE